MNLIEFLVFISDQALIQKHKYLQPGHNGPYHVPETPVRNTGYWLITFAKVYELTGKVNYLDAIKLGADFLISKDSRPFDYSFYHRGGKKDKCNGLIGQAWTFEALARASEILDDPIYAHHAEEVFFQHPFNQYCGLWNRLEIDGTTLSTDPTFNHQLWFAACASLLKSPRSQEIRERICLFMDFLPENLFVLDNGLIYHPIKTALNFNDSSRSVKLKLKILIKTLILLFRDKQIKSNNSNTDFKEKMIYKSAGYHQFNMYAFAMVKQSFPDHSFWLTEQFTRSLDYLMTDKFVDGLMENKFGYPYNPPGFEVPFAISALTDMTEDKLVYETSMWINEQFKRCYNSDTRMMDRNTEDPLTHTARVYELTRLSNSILKKTEVDLEFVGDLRNNEG